MAKGKSYTKLPDVQRGPYRGMEIETPQEMAELLSWLAWMTSGFNNYGVAAIIVDKGTREVVSVGLNSVIAPFHLHDDYYHAHTDGHAEMNALRGFDRAKEFNKSSMEPEAWKEKYDPENYELWTNLQPCRMCESAIGKFGMDTHFLALDPVIDPIDKVYSGPQNRELREKLNSLIRCADGELLGAFAGQVINNEEFADAAVKPFAETADDVRKHKQKKETRQDKRLIDIAKLLESKKPKRRQQGEALLHYIQAIVPDWKDSFGYRNASPADSEVHKMVATRAIRSHLKGEDHNSCAVIDPFGTVWFVVGDHTESQNPLRSPPMRAFKRLENILESVPGDMRPHLPTAGQFTFVCYREPDMLVTARAASAYARSIHYLTKDEKLGVVSTGQLPNIGEFYLKFRKIGEAIHPVEVGKHTWEVILRQARVQAETELAAQEARKNTYAERVRPNGKSQSPVRGTGK